MISRRYRKREAAARRKLPRRVRNRMSDCAVCDRLASSDEVYCEYHLKAFESLRDSYEQWKEALEISWVEYMKQLLETESTGVWIRELAQCLREEDSS
jgi:hypothetical protein